MADSMTVQQWTDQYNNLKQNLDSVTGEINSYLRDGGSKSNALYEAQKLQLQLEYNLNQHIESAYTPELMDTYFQYQNQKVDYRPEKIDGVIYNNGGQPLAWDPDTNWGLYNQFLEIRSFLGSATNYKLASFVQNNLADIVDGGTAVVKEFISSFAGKIFGMVHYSYDPIEQKMSETVLELSLGKAYPGDITYDQLQYDTFYQFLFGSYSPTLDGIVLSPSILNGLTQSYFQEVQSDTIQNAIDRLNNPENNQPNIFEKILDFFISPAQGSDINPLVTNLQNLFHQAEVTRSPIVLDLNGDGVRTVGKGAGVNFDHNNNNFAELTGWVSKEDGLLVRDLNGNGKIDNGGELFGNNIGLLGVSPQAVHPMSQPQIELNAMLDKSYLENREGKLMR